MLLALRDDTDEFTLGYDRDDAGYVRHGRFVQPVEAAPDEFAAVEARGRRPDDPPMEHARYTDIVHIDKAAERLVRDIRPADRPADDTVVGHGLERGAYIKGQ